MTASRFQVRECSNTECRLRFPLNPQTHSGAYCPRCGAPTLLAEEVGEQSSCGEEVETQKGAGTAGLLDNIRSSFNVGAMFRTADGAGLDHLYLCGITPTPDDNDKISKTALGAEESLPWSYHANGLDAAVLLQERGARLIALECTQDATPLYHYETKPDDGQLTVLIVSNELTGIDPGLIEMCETVLYIPMRGEKGSLNAAVAFGIAAYWITKPVQL